MTNETVECLAAHRRPWQNSPREPKTVNVIRSVQDLTDDEQRALIADEEAAATIMH